MRFEVKLRQVDTQLKLIEAKLESVPVVQTVSRVGNDASGDVQDEKKVDNEVKVVEEKIEVIETSSEETSPVKSAEEIVPEPVETPTGVKAKEDYRYKKYFKMIQFGVPPAAIKMKLQAEGMNPDILDSPDKILPDGVIEPVAIDSDSNSESD